MRCVALLLLLSAPALADVSKDDVLNLVKQEQSDEVIIAYIQSIGTAMKLSVNDIIEMKKKGTSDFVILAMLDHQRKPPKPVKVNLNFRPLDLQALKEKHARNSRARRRGRASVRPRAAYRCSPK